MIADRDFQLAKMQALAIIGDSFVPVGDPRLLAYYANTCGHRVGLHQIYCHLCGKPTDLGMRNFELKLTVVSDDQT